ncbi:hypothetical protein, partial [uncultured Phocaeicola sp.]
SIITPKQWALSGQTVTIVSRNCSHCLKKFSREFLRSHILFYSTKTSDFSVFPLFLSIDRNALEKDLELFEKRLSLFRKLLGLF